MPLTAGLALAAVGSTIPLAITLIVLLCEVRTGPRFPAGARSALWFLAAGTAVVAVGLTCAAVFVRGGSPDRAALAGAVALGGALALILLVVGLLRLPGVVATDAARLRHTLDGLTIGVSIFVVVWLALHAQVALDGTDTAGGGPDLRTLVVATSGLSMVASVGIVGITVFRATIARQAVLACALGVVAMASGVHGLSAAVRDGAGLRAAVWAVVGSVGLLLLLGTVWRVQLLRLPAPEQVRTTIAFAVVPTLVALGSTLLYAVVIAAPDRVAVFGTVLLGFGLAGRQAVAHREIQAQAVELAVQREQFRTLALTDPLTSLANRRRLLETLRADDRAGEPCVLIAIDLDGFKNVNDLRGHDVGDLVLGQVAKRLREATRPGDLAARLGGDEFAVVLHAPLNRAQQIAERLLVTLSAPYDVRSGTVVLSASIGLAGTGDGNLPSLLHNADVALRAAKQRGKNRIERYAVADERWLRRRTALEQQLHHAIARGEMGMAYQPVVAVPGGRPVGVEALLRWNSPVLGTVPAAEFIPVAEESGLIAALDRWALHQACHRLTLWLGAGYDIWMSVNVSAYNLRRAEFAAEAAEVLRAHGYPVRRLVLEVAVQDPALDGFETATRLAELRSLGVRIALDHFGTGRSSFRHITELPIDVIKINMSRIAGPGGDEVATGRRVTQVLRALAGLGQGLGLDVIAGGVCGPDQEALVAAAGIGLAQGELYLRPLPAEHVEAVLDADSRASAARVVPPRAPVAVRLPGESRDSAPVTRTGVQDMGQVDSGREMRQS